MHAEKQGTSEFWTLNGHSVSAWLRLSAKTAALARADVRCELIPNESNIGPSDLDRRVSIAMDTGVNAFQIIFHVYVFFDIDDRGLE